MSIIRRFYLYRVVSRVDGDGQDSIARLDRRARNSYSLYLRSMMVSALTAPPPPRHSPSRINVRHRDTIRDRVKQTA